MENFKLSRSPISMKLLVTALSCVLGLTYMLLLFHIWTDTEMKPSLVSKAYVTMEYTELTNITHTYMPYYTIYLFAVPVLIFMFTSYSEKIKRIFAVLPFILIPLDMGSMWAIPYVSPNFSWLLWSAGSLLATTFLLLFIFNMYDLWLKK